MVDMPDVGEACASKNFGPFQNPVSSRLGIKSGSHICNPLRKVTPTECSHLFDNISDHRHRLTPRSTVRAENPIGIQSIQD